MLNEFLEVTSYLENPIADDIRLNYKLLSDDFKGKCKLDGIADVLTLIACHYIYDFCKVTEVSRKIADKTILILRIWCGFEEDVSSEELEKAKIENQEWFKTYPYAEGWLCSYHDKYLKEEGGAWSVYSLEWKKKLHSSNVYRAEKVSYENILAQAVARGSLKNYYLVVSKKYEDIINNEVINAKGKRLATGRQRTMLKFLGAYSVLQLLHPKQKFVLMQSARILNWLGYDANKPERIVGDIIWNGEPIFQLDGQGDFRKFSVNSKFLSEIELKVQEGEINQEPDVYDMYQDIGHGKKKGLRKL